MYDYLLSAISCVCIIHAGLCGEECNAAVLARRGIFYVPAGGSLSLSCVVQHCGASWTGTWLWKNSTDENLMIVKDTARHHLTKVKLSYNETQLVLKLLNVNLSDEGYYGCSVTWGEGNADHGHLMYVNITAAVPSQRNYFHRIFICAGAFLCLPIILGLARCLSSEVEPQPLPMTQFTYAAVHRDEPRSVPQPPPQHPVPQKRNPSSHKAAPPKSPQKTEVVYADISQDALRQHGVTGRKPDQTTVYSSLKFS